MCWINGLSSMQIPPRTVWFYLLPKIKSILGGIHNLIAEDKIAAFQTAAEEVPKEGGLNAVHNCLNINKCIDYSRE